MSQMPLVVSFYTINTPYEQEVQALMQSCSELRIEHQIEGVPSAGSWEMNCAFKPLFLLKKFEELQRPLLWVDADAVFISSPYWVDAFSLDFGVRLYDCPNDHPSRVVSSTVFINSTPKGERILKLWAATCLAMLREKNRKEEVWDQDALRKVLFEKEHGASWGALPNVYSMIPGHPEDEKIQETPVLIQNQASRRLKKWINTVEGD